MNNKNNNNDNDKGGGTDQYPGVRSGKSTRGQASCRLL